MEAIAVALHSKNQVTKISTKIKKFTENGKLFFFLFQFFSNGVVYDV